MEISAEEQPIIDAMLTTFGEGSNMGSFQGGQNLLSRDRAAASIRVEYNSLKSSLTKARSNKDRTSVSLGWRFTDAEDSVALGASRDQPLDLSPQGRTGLIDEGIPPADLDVPVPARNRESICGIEEDRIGQHHTADPVVLEVVRTNTAVTLYAGAHLGERRRTVRRAEVLPGKAHRKFDVLDEEGNPCCQPTLPGVEFKDEGLPWSQDAEPMRARLPEVDLMEIGERAEIVEPVSVGEAYKGSRLSLRSHSQLASHEELTSLSG